MKGKSLMTKLSSCSAARQRLPLVFQFYFIPFRWSDVQPVWVWVWVWVGGWVHVFYHHSLASANQCFISAQKQSEMKFDSQHSEIMFKMHKGLKTTTKKTPLIWVRCYKMCAHLLGKPRTQCLRIYYVSSLLEKQFTWKTFACFVLSDSNKHSF